MGYYHSNQAGSKCHNLYYPMSSAIVADGKVYYDHN